MRRKLGAAARPVGLAPGFYDDPGLARGSAQALCAQAARRTLSPREDDGRRHRGWEE